MLKQQRLLGTGDTYLLGKVLQVCASDKRQGVPIQKKKERKKLYLNWRKATIILLHLANTSADGEPPTHRRFLHDGQ